MKEQREILIPVSAGELVDKITILRIKSERINGPDLSTAIHRELAQLEAIAHGAFPQLGEIELLTAELAQINARLWQVEDDIRQCEGCGDFGPQFVGLARSVYRLNDARADIKRRINNEVGSALIEAKQYAQYH